MGAALAGVGTLATQIVAAQTFYVSVAGTLAPGGALLKRAQVAFASALVPAGALVRRAVKGMAGALTPTGYECGTQGVAAHPYRRTGTGGGHGAARSQGRGKPLAAAGVLVYLLRRGGGLEAWLRRVRLPGLPTLLRTLRVC